MAAQAMSASGIVYDSPGTGTGAINGTPAHGTHSQPGTRVYLPLEEVRVKATVVDGPSRFVLREKRWQTLGLTLTFCLLPRLRNVNSGSAVSAKVTIIQRYCNPSTTATPRCKYFFPVPASAAVCAFRMETDNGRVVEGVCKEKDRAEEEFEQAVEEGRTAALMEYVNDDTFVISIGSIPAQTGAEIKLVYVMSLMNDDVPNGIRFQLPMAVGHRYGPTPPPLQGAVQPHQQNRDQIVVSVSIDIQTHGRIEKVECPSHPQQITETKYVTDAVSGRVSSRRTNISYRSSSFLGRDFLLLIHAEGLDEPRCFAELCKNPKRLSAGGDGERERGRDTLALQLTIIPRFTLESIPSQEYIFLMDRSGSMEGASIRIAKETLTILLRLIPSSSCTFNIFSFGSTVQTFRPQSLVFDQANLDSATAHVEQMGANLGGTEIRQALEAVFRTWSRTLPVALFVLTDGGVFDIDGTVNAVRAAVQSRPGPPARVYTLGIGDGVSTAMCEAIARAGNGICLLALAAESIVGRCARLFHAGSKRGVENVTMDWGIPAENRSMVGDSEGNSPTTTVRFAESRISWKTPTIQQAPSVIPNLHADIRMGVCALITLPTRSRRATIPKAVKLQGQMEGTGDIFEMKIPVCGIHLEDDEPSVPMVHTLAAWHIIQEHQEKVAPLPQVISTPRGTDDELRKAIVVRLGERYQVISAHTSFVAVDYGRDYARSIDDLQFLPYLGDDGGSRSGQDSGDESERSNSRSDGQGDADGDSSQDEATPEPEPGPSSQSHPLGIVLQVAKEALGSIAWWVASTLTYRPSRSSSPRRARDRSRTERVPHIPGGWRDSEDEDEEISTEDSDSDRTFTTLSSLESDYDCPSCYGSNRSPSPVSRPPMPTQADVNAYRSPSPRLCSRRRLARTGRISSQQPNAAPSDRPVRVEVVRMVKLQEVDGSFPLSDELKRMIGNVAFVNPNPPGVDGRVWATALAVAFLTKHMDGQKELLGDILAKPLDFLRKQSGGDELVKQAKSLLGI
ncbi:hypothetical protein AX16_000573 [Volvariella volvacea WC 439]|nr:hypothetical protein AX16_000573 [Volvariella volvacea WC 439]